jgi:DNA-binding MarR family transcriptional regulator
MSDTQADTLNSEMPRLTWQLRQQAKHTFDTFELLPDKGMILIALRAGVDRPGELATELDIKKTTISKRLSDLEAQGLIERRKAAGSEDGRGIHLWLTPKGKKTAQALLESWREGVRQDLRLTPEEHKAFEAWCKRLVS